MSKAEKMEVEGTIIHIDKTLYTVELDMGVIVKGYSSGKMKKYSINLTLSDRVIIELDGFNPNLGRITKRL